MSTAVYWSTRFAHIVEDIKRLKLPRGTMLAGELVAPGRDSYPYVLGLSKGHTPRALEDMKKNGLPQYYWWDVPFFNGEDLVKTKPPEYRWKIIQEYIKESHGHLLPIQFFRFKNPDEAVAYAKEHGLEGWVVVDPHTVYGDRGWNLKGKPDRPKTCAKLKPWFEDDFVAYWDPDNGIGEWGTGRHEKGKKVTLPNGQEVIHGGVGSIFLYQYDAKGNLTPISKCGGGMDYEFQAQLRKEHFPFVIESQYAERTYISDGDKTNALRLPKFVRVRTDKKPEECTNQRL
jgi:ATP-dependent DNA ligase